MEHAATHLAPGGDAASGAPAGAVAVGATATTGGLGDVSAGVGVAATSAVPEPAFGPLGVDLGALTDAWQRLAAAATGPVGQVERVSAIRALEDVKDAVCAAQAELAVAVVANEVGAAEAACDAAGREECGPRVRARKVAQARRSAIGQVALARRESPSQGQVLVGVAEALVYEMPHTLAALRAGVLNEYRARIVVRETACLDRQARARVDAAVCADQSGLQGVGTKRLAALVEAQAYRQDPVAVVNGNERSVAERSVSLRPAPGGMTYLTALVPLAQGVGVWASLQRTADTARATGDGRSKGQVMADTLIERVTGQASAQGVPVMVNLIMSDATLLASGHDPAVLDGGHMIPAQSARELIAHAMDNLGTLTKTATGADAAGGSRSPSGSNCPAGTSSPSKGSPPGTGSPPGESSTEPVKVPARVGAWVRRVYADAGGGVVAMDSHARTFPDGLARLLRVRDQGLCRTPWCDAPVAHTDHITPHAVGGATTAVNGQGLCAGCNYTKQTHGWTQEVDPDTPRHTVTTMTPTGHEYVSTAPAVPAPLTPNVVATASEPASAASRDRVIDIKRPPPGASPIEITIERFLQHAA